MEPVRKEEEDVQQEDDHALVIKRSHPEMASTSGSNDEERSSQRRRACDFCTRRKRKCDGKIPCSNCVEMGIQNSCQYSLKLKSGRKKQRTEVLALMSSQGSPYRPTFSPSAATGLIGTMESYFMSIFLRDFNRFVPLTTEQSVTAGMLEVLKPSHDMSDPIKIPGGLRKARQALFWGVCAMGSKIMDAPNETTEGYVRMLYSAIRECFDTGEKEVVQAYLLLSTLEEMRGDEEKRSKSLKFAESIFLGLQDNPAFECDESLGVLMYIYANKLMSSGGSDRSLSKHGKCQPDLEAAAVRATRHQLQPSDAIQLIAEMGTYTHQWLSAPTLCEGMKQQIDRVEMVIQAANEAINNTSLRECVAGIVPIRIWAGISQMIRDCQVQSDEQSLDLVREGIRHATMRPGMMNFSLWRHALHSAAYVLSVFGSEGEFEDLREVYNANTMDSLPAKEVLLLDRTACCSGSNCQVVARWLQRVTLGAEGAGVEELQYRPCVVSPCHESDVSEEDDELDMWAFQNDLLEMDAIGGDLIDMASPDITNGRDTSFYAALTT